MTTPPKTDPICVCADPMWHIRPSGTAICLNCGGVIQPLKEPPKERP